MSTGADSPEVGSSPIETIDNDLPCVRCGYNLRSLAISGRCPECGAPVRHTLGEDWLRYDRPAHVRHLHRTIGRALIGFWVMNVGIISAFVLPLLIFDLDIIVGHPTVWHWILSLGPGILMLPAGLFLVLRFTSRIRIVEPEWGTMVESSGLRSALKSKFVGLAVVVIFIAEIVGLLITIRSTSGQFSEAASQARIVCIILSLGSIAAIALWLHAMIVVIRIIGIEKRCKGVSARRRRRTAAALQQVKLDPPVLILMAWALWLFRRGFTEDLLGLVSGLVLSILVFVALIWWLTISMLHRTRKIVASEMAAMEDGG